MKRSVLLLLVAVCPLLSTAQSGSYEVLPTWLNMRVGDEVELSAIRTSPPYDRPTNLAWSSADPSIARMVDGRLKAMALGTTVVQTQINGQSACRVVNVLPTDPKPTPDDTIVVDVCIVVYDPYIPSQQKRLSEILGWHDHTALTNSVISSFQTVSEGVVQFRIARVIEGDLSIVRKQGRSATAEDVYNFFIGGGLGKPIEWSFSYEEFIQVHGLCELRNSGVIDEVWTWVFPGMFTMWESTLAGPGAFWYNSSPVQGTSCQKLLPIMALNYERTYDLALHSFGHRMESTMAQVYRGWDARRSPGTPYDQFTSFKHVTGGRSVCGNIHYPPNGVSDYDYGNGSTVTIRADEWHSWPHRIGREETVTCSEWQCTQEGFMRWWFDHVPNSTGMTDTVLNNWWYYLFAYEEAQARAKTRPASKDKTEPVLSIAINNSQETFCEGDTVILSATAGYQTYRWSNGATTRTTRVTKSGTYTVECRLSPCGNAQDPIATIDVEIKPRSEAPQISSSCGFVYAPGNALYNWYRDGVLLWGQQNPTLRVQQAGQYAAERVATSEYCASYRSNIVTATPNVRPVLGTRAIYRPMIIGMTDTTVTVGTTMHDDCPNHVLAILDRVKGASGESVGIELKPDSLVVSLAVSDSTDSVVSIRILVRDSLSFQPDQSLDVELTIIRDDPTTVGETDDFVEWWERTSPTHGRVLMLRTKSPVDHSSLVITDLLGRRIDNFTVEASLDHHAIVRIHGEDGLYGVLYTDAKGLMWRTLFNKSE